MQEDPETQAFWAISQTRDSLVAWWKIAKNPLNVGPINHSETCDEERLQRDQRYGGKPFWGDVWYEKFENIPIVKLPTSYHPDYFSDKGLDFVSPRLFKLLDQPQGSLQGLPTETIWFGPEYPDWEYIWLSFVPRIPAIDMSRCRPEDLEEKFDAVTGKTLMLSLFARSTPLLEGLTSPFGTFRAAESPSLRVVSDAIALSVLQAGCTGIEFKHVETFYGSRGPLYRRCLHGIERNPGLLEE